MSIRRVLTAIVLLVGASCSSSGETVDAGMDSGADAAQKDVGLDASTPDATEDATTDAGDSGASDGGATDADVDADGGEADASEVDASEADSGEPGDGGNGGEAGIDAGTPDIGPAPEGEIWIAELGDGQAGAFTAFAELEDRANATFDVYRARYTQPDAACDLVRETLLSGQVLGIDTASIAVDFDNGQLVVYQRVAAGRFEPLLPPTAGLFAGSTTVSFDLVSTNQAGTLAGARFDLAAAPPLELVAPFPGVPIFTALGAGFNWVPSTPIGNRRTIVELYDATREVVLTCVLIGDPGVFVVPAAALQDFAGQNPPQPWSIELRYEYAATTVVPIIASTSSVTVDFHTAQGWRWPAF